MQRRHATQAASHPVHRIVSMRRVAVEMLLLSPEVFLDRPKIILHLREIRH